MTASAEHDYIQMYEDAMRSLRVAPGDRNLQHQAILSLARAGSLDYAISEFKRFGLDSVRNDEHIMALDARLSKDLFLRSPKNQALDHARESAEKYEIAFKASSGYYPGINAATMSLMADYPTSVVNEKAKAILDSLPDPQSSSEKEHYFIEATRAEGYLLLGETIKAEDILYNAIASNPLDYASHATTLKQFHMIAKKKGLSNNSFAKYTPPKSAHFGGHIFGNQNDDPKNTKNLSLDEEKALSIKIADAIQKNDVGFGYGALAAGSDILIAETLLQEGAELHVVLPTDRATFVKHSVVPFGEDWVARFNQCLKQAASVAELSHSRDWPDRRLNRFAGQVAMGQTVLRAKSLSADSCQLLVWHAEENSSNTSLHAQDWQTSNNAQIIIPFPSYVSQRHQDANIHSGKTEIYPYRLHLGGDTKSTSCDNISRLENLITDKLDRGSKSGLGLHIDLPDSRAGEVLAALTGSAHPKQMLISEVAASHLTFLDPSKYHVTYAGRVPLNDNETVRVYSLHISDTDQPID